MDGAAWVHLSCTLGHPSPRDILVASACVWGEGGTGLMGGGWGSAEHPQCPGQPHRGRSGRDPGHGGPCTHRGVPCAPEP